MKRLTLLMLVTLIGCVAIYAEGLTEEQAFRKAQQFMPGKQFKQKKARRAQGAADRAYYVFNAEKNDGFVVIAGNDLMPEVLGYAEHGNLDLEKAPDNVRWLFDYYAQVAQSLKNVPADEAAVKRMAVRRRTAAARPELKALMNTEWNQDGIYQEHCPEIGDKKALTGCVATAMAQVVNFFQWPLNSVREAVGYLSNKDDQTKPQRELETLPARKFNWFNLSNDDIAWLMRYCGQSVLMNYNTDESTSYASSIPGALISVFNYSKAVDLVNRDEFTDEEWEDALYKEIELGRPVIYSGFKNKKGHTFVLHGYKDGKFIINWGWGGFCDGEFALTNLTPNGNDFTEDQNAVVGIQPASNNDISYDEKPEIGFLEVHVEEQGQLEELIPESDRYRISRLKIIGVVGGKDIDVIRDMSLNRYNAENQGRLSKLDLSEARFVSGANYNGSYPMTDNAVEDWMFNNCATLKEIVLPQTTVSIGQYALAGTGLTSMVIPRDVQYIAGNALALPDLKSLVVDEDNKTFYSQNNAIYERATGKLVRGCRASGIPEGVEEIGDNAFQKAGLESIVLPKSLKKIGYWAFYFNDKVKDVYIPENVEFIGNEPFRSCGLVSIKVDGNNPNYDSRNNCNAIIETATNTLIQGCATTKIPDGVEAIASRAFAEAKVSVVDIPSSVTQLGMMPFEETGRTLSTYKVSWDEPMAIESQYVLGDPSWDHISRNARLIVPNGKKGVYEAAPYWGEMFTSLERKILEVSEYEANRSLTVNVAEAGTLNDLVGDKKGIVEELKVTGQINGYDIQCLRDLCGQGGLVSDIDLSNASIVDGYGATANELPQSAFVSTSSLKHIVLPKNLTAIGAFAFEDSGVEELVLPKTVTSIGRDVFYYARNLKALSVEAGNTVFDSRDKCNAIIETATNTLRIGCVNTIIPEDVTALGNMSFSGVPALKEIVIPNSVTSLGWATFWADIELSKVTMSAKITELGESPFGGCDRITSFIIDKANPKYDSRENCNAIIETASNKLIQGFATTKIPNDVKIIAAAAFRSLSTLTEIEIPASVEKIEPEAFLYCNQMTKVTSHIKKPFAVSSMVFSGDNMKIAKLYVPYGTKEAYANTPGWDNFPYIIEMDPVDGEYAHHAASVVTTNFGKAYAALNGQVSVPVTLAGEGIDPINSIDYTITTGGNTTQHHLELTTPITYMMTADVLVPLPADASVGERDKVITLTKVNDKANECTTENMTATGKLVTVAKKPKVVPVLEEATGTWCGWCARGIPALTLLNKIYKDNVITIAVHNGDPMALNDYQLTTSGYPSCQINRGEFLDPYYGNGSQAFGISTEVEAVQRSYVPAGIEVEASWADDTQQKINVKATTTFVDNVDEANYRIGYVLTQDGMTGETPDWYQTNYYAGSSLNDLNLVNLTTGQSKITNAVYNYVPVAAYEPFNGIEGSVPANIVKDKAMQHNYVMDISANKYIQDKKKLAVIALLIDKNNNKIVNAAKYKFDKDSDAGSGGFPFLGILGDANSDGSVTISDAVTVVNYIQGKASDSFNKRAANVNGDVDSKGKPVISITDAVGIVNILLNQ